MTENRALSLAASLARAAQRERERQDEIRCEVAAAQGFEGGKFLDRVNSFADRKRSWAPK